MLYRQAGKTGQMTSILGFGCMRLPILEHKAHLIDEEKAQAMVDYAIRHGVNYFDTAYIYHSEVPFQAGMSELFLGRALKNQRQEVHVATKLPSWFVESRADMDRYLDEQLARLQTDHIDFYLVHNLTGEMCEEAQPARHDRIPRRRDSRRQNQARRFFLPRRSTSLQAGRGRLRLVVLPDSIQLHG